MDLREQRDGLIHQAVHQNLGSTFDAPFTPRIIEIRPPRKAKQIEELGSHLFVGEFGEPGMGELVQQVVAARLRPARARIIGTYLPTPEAESDAGLLRRDRGATRNTLAVFPIPSYERHRVHVRSREICELEPREAPEYELVELGSAVEDVDEHVANRDRACLLDHQGLRCGHAFPPSGLQVGGVVASSHGLNVVVAVLPNDSLALHGQDHAHATRTTRTVVGVYQESDLLGPVHPVVVARRGDHRPPPLGRDRGHRRTPQVRPRPGAERLGDGVGARDLHTEQGVGKHCVGRIDGMDLHLRRSAPEREIPVHHPVDHPPCLHQPATGGS